MGQHWRLPAPPSDVPEHGWLRETDSADVAIAVHRFGRGTAIYFAHEIMRQCSEDGHRDFTSLLGRAVELGLGDSRLIWTDAPASVRMSLVSDGAGDYTLSLVNHTSTGHRPMGALVPVRGFEVRLAFNEPGPMKGEVLYGEGVRSVATEPGGVRIRFDRLDAFAAIGLGKRK